MRTTITGTGVIAILLVVSGGAICKGAQQKARPGANPHLHSPPSSSGYTAEDTARYDKRRRALTKADDKKRVELLRSYILADFPGQPKLQRLSSIAADTVRKDDVEWLCSLCRQGRGARGGQRREYVLYLLAILGRTSDSPAVGKAIRDVFDKFYVEVADKMRTAHGFEVREPGMLWGDLISAIGKYGESELLTPAFWKAAEAVKFMYFSHIIRRQASPEMFEKLNSYKETPLWKDERLRERLEKFITEVRIVLDYPEVRTVPQKYYGRLVRHLADMEPKRREKELKRWLAMIRRWVEKEEKEKAADSTSKPSDKKESSGATPWGSDPKWDADSCFVSLAHGLCFSPRFPPSNVDMLTPNQRNCFQLLVARAEQLAERFLKEQDPRRRGLAVLVFGLADSPKYLSKVAGLVEDEDVTISRAPPGAWPVPYSGKVPPWAEKQTVRDLVLIVFGYRFGSWHHPCRSAKEFAKYWKAVPRPNELPSEWVFRFNKARGWNLPTKPLKDELTKVRPPDRAIVMTSVAAFVPEVYSEDALVATLRRDVPADALRGYLDGSWRLPGMTLISGPNSRDQRECRKLLLRILPRLLKPEDGQWVLALAKRGKALRTDHVIAAARLDPLMGKGWLQAALRQEQDQFRRCRLLVALARIGGGDVLEFVVARYYRESKPEYSAGGLQEHFVREILNEASSTSKPLLERMILDGRFTSLSWAPTRAIAHGWRLFFTERPREVGRYLGVKHRMGTYDFEQRPKLRQEYPVDTKHVLMQTRAFQQFLQQRLRKANTHR